tara:strand:+ start:817 stop:1260 length:444 start_codon:yes stop_codon:yes gene_type:complete
MIINNSSIRIQFEKKENITNLKHGKGFIFELNFWNQNKKEIIKKTKNIGIQINSNESISTIIEDIQYFQLICFNFLTFKDGRPFTYSKKLRETFKFMNQIRASGHILPDQYIFLLRCGFDAFDISEKDSKIWKDFLVHDSGLYYQPK